MVFYQNWLFTYMKKKIKYENWRDLELIFWIFIKFQIPSFLIYNIQKDSLFSLFLLLNPLLSSFPSYLLYLIEITFNIFSSDHLIAKTSGRFSVLFSGLTSGLRVILSTTTSSLGRFHLFL